MTILYILCKRIITILLSASPIGQLEQQQSSSINILLVDDEEDILYTFKESLASEGYNVEAFVDPMEALTYYAKSKPSHYNLAILDIRMPGLNGLQLYYRLKAINRNIKILFLGCLWNADTKTRSRRTQSCN